MADVQPMGLGLAHVVFLERAAREEASSQSRFGQAAFLVLRLIDVLGADETRGQKDLFNYQAAATGRYCQEQLEPGPETDRLLELVHQASHAHRHGNPALVTLPMFDLTRDLIAAGRWDEAIDVLATLERTAGARLEPAAAITSALLQGRAYRSSAQFDEANAAYARAETLAGEAGDRRSVLLSRIGRANVLQSRGNLVEVERVYLELLGDSCALGDVDLEARVEHGIGVILGMRGQLPEALPHLWRAFELQHPLDPVESFRVLGDIGYALSGLGAVADAERAYRIVVQRTRSQDQVNNALIELMHCASFRRDRIGFARWSGECAQALPRMAPNQVVDYHLKVGIGLARFGLFDRAPGEMRLALEVARTYGLHEFEFRIERILAGLPLCRAMQHEVETEQPAWANVSTVSIALAGLAPDHSDHL